VDTLRQEYMLVPAKVKDCNLVYLLRCEEPDEDEKDEEGNPLEMISIIVFTATCKYICFLFHCPIYLQIRTIVARYASRTWY
jgi:hypothetical protein